MTGLVMLASACLPAWAAVVASVAPATPWTQICSAGAGTVNADGSAHDPAAGGHCAWCMRGVWVAVLPPPPVPVATIATRGEPVPPGPQLAPLKAAGVTGPRPRGPPPPV